MAERNYKRDVWIGIGLLLLLHPLNFLVEGAILFIGLAQLVYLIPLVAWFAWRKRHGIIHGLTIGAGITLLLNATCFGIVWFQFMS